MHNEVHDSESPTSTIPAHNLNLRRTGIVAAIIAIAIVSSGVLIRRSRASDTKQWTNERAIPSVLLIKPVHGDSQHDLRLPGRLQAYNEAPIFARVSGYLKRWNVDIGAQVHAGQILAEIETPEIDEQLKQVKADLADAESREKLAEITAKRWKNLLASDSVSQQEADQKAADLAVSQSVVAAAEANMNRIQALESFKHVTAPFDGIVTARETDIGALINAGSGSGVELFKVADVHKLRLYVQIPQIYAEKTKAGMPALLTVPEHPGQVFSGKMTSDSGAINPLTGTLLAEFEVENKTGLLKPGSYAEAKLGLPQSASTVRVPASALIVRHGGVQLALVDTKGHAILKKVTIGLDYGNDVEILSGLDPADQIIDSPPDSLEEGDLVHVEKPAPVLAEANTTSTPGIRE